MNMVAVSSGTPASSGATGVLPGAADLPVEFIASGQALNGVPAISGLVEDDDLLVAVIGKVFTNAPNAGTWGVTSAGLAPGYQRGNANWSNNHGVSILVGLKSAVGATFAAPTIVPTASANASFDNYVFGYGAFRNVPSSTLHASTFSDATSSNSTSLSVETLAGGLGVSVFLARGQNIAPTVDPGDFTTFVTYNTASNTDISIAAAYILPTETVTPGNGSWGTTNSTVLRTAASFGEAA